MEETTQRPAAAPRSAVVDWPKFVALVRSCERFLLTTHIRPDCDALGSTLAMAAILEQLGKTVSVVTASEVPPRMAFLDPQKRIKRLDHDLPRDQLPPFDLLLVLDTSAWAQLGEMGAVIRATTARKAVLDHHVSADDLGAEFFRNTAAEATGRLVSEAAEQLGATLTPEIATMLYAAVATDTGWYRFASTTAETYRLAARLIDAGAVPDQIYRSLYENETLARLQLTGRTLARTVSELGGRLIHTWIPWDDFTAVGALPSDSEDLINLTLSVGGTEAAVILVEQPSGGFKVSFRSRGGLDCSRIAEKFGGGGHKAAAGAFVPDPIAVAQAKVLGAVRAAMQ